MLLDKTPKETKIILAEDFNERITNKVIDSGQQRFNKDTINANGEMSRDTCTHNELRINNTFFPYTDQHKTTWTNSINRKIYKWLRDH